jgi:hypothetical protein
MDFWKMIICVEINNKMHRINRCILLLAGENDGKKEQEVADANAKRERMEGETVWSIQEQMAELFD